MGKQKVTFKPGMVSTTIRSGPATSYPAIGYVLDKNEPSFYTETEGKNGWHKLIGREGYAYVATWFATIEIENTQPPSQNIQPKTTTPNTTNTQPPKEKSADYDKIEKLMIEGVDLSKYNKDFSNSLNVEGFGFEDASSLSKVLSSGSFPPVVGQKNSVAIYDYFTDYGFIEKNLKKIESNLNLIGVGESASLNSDLFSKFNRFRVGFPEYHLGKTFSHIFFTRPDLNLFDFILANNRHKLLPDVENDPVYYYLYKSNPEILLSLCKDYTSDHDFHPFLSNVAQSFEVSDEYIKTLEHGETLTGYKVMYGKHNIESKTSGTFSINYTDDNNFSVYKTHKAWIDYISKVYRGELKPKNEYINSKILDYACSVYYFLLGPDGETIIFWSKYFGVFPTNAPSSMSSWSKGSQVKIPEYTISYAYAFKEDFSPLSLAEFNMNSRGNLFYKKTYESELAATGKTFAGAPFIETDQNNGYVFKLRFRV